MQSFARETVLAILGEVCEKIKENRDFLTDLDAAIGDADHGINMERGFDAVRERLNSLGNQDIGAILKSVGTTLVSFVGGASGPLYGTAFIEGGKIVQGKIAIGRKDIIAIGEAALLGIKRRGRSDRGDKTMIDAIEPALVAFRSADTILNGLARASEAAHRGVEETIQMVARKGRASYLGERSMGHQDPGATSSALMIEATYQSVKVMEE